VGLDFLEIVDTLGKNNTREVWPQFNVCKSKDLMIKGSDFYAIYDESTGLWSADQFEAVRLIDNEIQKRVTELKAKYPESIVVGKFLRNTKNKTINGWRQYCKQQTFDNYKDLDAKVLFFNDKPKKSDYATHVLPYSIEEGDMSSYDRLMSVLYSDEEREKIEWAIGSIIAGDSKKNQKFIVLYGAGGTGKGTVIDHIIEPMFEGYYCTFSAKNLTSASNSFAMEDFRLNPLIAIDADGDMNKLDDNTRLNGIVSHEYMTVNEKFKSSYTSRFNALCIIGTNRPVRITDSKSGLIRRLIDISPTGNKVGIDEYNKLIEGVQYEFGAIAYKSLNFYKKNKHKYDAYIPTKMMGASNDLYNFLMDNAEVVDTEEGIDLASLWVMYKDYCADSLIQYPLKRNILKEELKDYFRFYQEKLRLEDGRIIYSVYKSLRRNKIGLYDPNDGMIVDEENDDNWLSFEFQHSLLDEFLADQKAQYAPEVTNKNMHRWANCKTTLKALDTTKLHYTLGPKNLVTIDFDKKDQNGNKSFEENVKAIERLGLPPTYAELSKSENGIHLEYLWNGDINDLSPTIEEDVEIKTFKGDSSLRRMLTKCNNVPIRTITSGLPIMKRSNERVINQDAVENEKHLRNRIEKALRREIGVDISNPDSSKAHTAPMIQYIKSELDKAYASGIPYDVSDIRNRICAFAMTSNHQKEDCYKKCLEMHFRSDNYPIDAYHVIHNDSVDRTGSDLVIFDCEVFKNLFVIVWKKLGKENTPQIMMNPSPREVQALFNYKLVGFNNRKYDNHILYFRAYLNYTNMQLYEKSKEIIKDHTGYHTNAYSISYTDIYDFMSNPNKQVGSLKKWEYKLAKEGYHVMHKENAYDWDEPVPEDKWSEIADYCVNDVLATEAVFNYPDVHDDYEVRCMLAEIAEMTPNDTTNSLSEKIIFGNDKHPQSQFNYRFLGDNPLNYPNLKAKMVTPFTYVEAEKITKDIIAKGLSLEDSVEEARFIALHDRLMPWFPGYKYDKYKKQSTYRDEDGSTYDKIDILTGKKKSDLKLVGEGGYVYSVPGMYGHVWTQDSASHHPHSIYAENLFGDVYTARFWELVTTRLAIKHKEWLMAESAFDGKLKKYLLDKGEAKKLATALKTVINSIYGLTAAKFDNPCKDERNIDNIVAKRGALFMIDLKHAVENMGYQVIHVKTDSIKIRDTSDDIIKFVRVFAALYGYEFETEEKYDRICLVNDAAYIARTEEGKWETKADEFRQPYTYKTLFTKEPIGFDDLCVVKSVQKGAIYEDFNEDLGADEHKYTFVGRVGQFTPVVNGSGGAELLCKRDDKYSAVTGTKGYRWLESSYVALKDPEELKSIIDYDYFVKQANDTKTKISKLGDFEWFTSASPYMPVMAMVKKPEDLIKHPVYTDEIDFDIAEYMDPPDIACVS
jgi:hypothetical protein